MNPHSITASMSLDSLLKTGAISQVSVTAAELEPTTTQFVNEHSIVNTYLYGRFDFMFLSCQVGLSE